MRVVTMTSEHTPAQMDPSFARSILRSLVDFDGPFGELMEIVRNLDDSPEKAALKNCCAVLLHMQFKLIEKIVAAFPELRDEDHSTRR